MYLLSLHFNELKLHLFYVICPVQVLAKCVIPPEVYHQVNIYMEYRPYIVRLVLTLLHIMLLYLLCVVLNTLQHFLSNVLLKEIL